MLDYLFENRNKLLTNLIRAGDSLGRSLRENVVLFSVNDNLSQVLYLTESNKIIRSKYDMGDNFILSEFEVEPIEIFEDQDKFDAFVSEKVSTLIHEIYSDSLDEAHSNFNYILDLWASKLKFNKVRGHLQERLEKLNLKTSLLKSDEFNKVKEIKESLIRFLKSNQKRLEKVNEIRNFIQLSELISTGCNCKQLTYENLNEDFVYNVDTKFNSSLYELVCRQELVKNELLESRNELNSIWISNEKVKAIAKGLKDEDKKVARYLAEAIKEVPYLAFATKKQLRTIVESSLFLDDGAIDPKEIKEYTNKLFELKKPVKQALIKVLSDKYSINFNNLKEEDTFSSLVNTQVLIFEVLSRVSPKNSVQRDVLTRFTESLKTKTGSVESIDLNTFIQEIFKDAGYTSFVEKKPLYENFDSKEVANDIKSLNALITLLGESSPESEDEAPQSPNDFDKELDEFLVTLSEVEEEE